MDQDDKLVRDRRHHLEELAGLGLEAWPRSFERTHTISAARAEHDPSSAEALEASTPKLALAGKVQGIRDFGKAAFLVLSDGLATIQVHVKKNVVAAPGFDIYQRLDLGDFVGALGRVFRTRSGELTIEATTLTFLAKALRPPPEKWHGLQDKELRYRQRYVDLFANPEVRQVFAARTRIVREIRRFLDENGFAEVETPMMQAIAGGATARPFTTHHNALDLDLFLRIAPELFLKRLIVGGYEKVYELNRNFRNEGISVRHNPEFTMLEFYEAYADYRRFMDFAEELLRTVAERAMGGTSFTLGDRQLDFGARPYARLRMPDAVATALAARPELGFPASAIDDLSALSAAALRLKPGKDSPYQGQSWGKLVAMLFEELVEPTLWGPVIVYDYPVEISPLAKRSPVDPRFVERFELYAGGIELVNAFSELNDPDDQRARFEEQARARAAGDDEAHPIDDDYTLALEHGMPPTAGAGIGIDRLTMLLTGSGSIRDVILFPLMRPR